MFYFPMFKILKIVKPRQKNSPNRPDRRSPLAGNDPLSLFLAYKYGIFIDQELEITLLMRF